MMKPQIVERLDFVAKRIPLRFLQINNEHSCYMSCDAYYVEIRLDQTMQFVKDVIVRHEANTEHSPCEVLKKVLVDQDYETFAKHLAGLHSIYSISTNDKKVKQKAYPTLIALESDLSILYDHQRRRISNFHELVHKTPLGIMEPRRGGFPVKLTYFITPHDLVDTTNHKLLIDLNDKNIINRNLGLSVTVEIEGSTIHKLQCKSLISTQQNSSLPSYAPFNSQNSEKLPAQFVLRLSQPFPMLNTSINTIVNEISEPATIKDYLTTITANSRESLISLIARQELDLNKGPFCRTVDSLKNNSDSCDAQKHIYTVKLLDQYHTYHILDHYLERQDGVYVTKIPFTHPTSIPTILKVLRQQALFNFVVGSCIRRGTSSSSSSSNASTNCNNVSEENLNSSAVHIFDVAPVSLTNVCVSFEHPSKESLATMEIDFKDITCQLYALDKESVCSNEYATRVLQQCWSIPITIRSVLKKCNERRLALLEDANKRRERELHELLASNTNQQTSANHKSQPPSPETPLQSKFDNLSEKVSTPRDLNSIAEFLTAKINASTSDSSNQATRDAESATDKRSNLLKKFSCKPKAKQNTATKNQTGNMILSLMLKRQNSTSSAAEDESLKATLTKKAKTKATQDSISRGFTSGISTTKLIGPEVANAARSTSKQTKQNATTQGGLSGSLSLIRSPSKSQNQTPVGSNISVGVSLNSLVNTPALGNNQPSVPLSVRFKGQTNNGNNAITSLSNVNNNNTAGKPRKSSINAILDRLVGGLNPPDPNSSILTQNDNSESGAKNSDSPKNISQSAKSKSRTPAPIDQFAIKQGSLGGLKLTVTKTKPASPSVICSTGEPSTSTPPNYAASSNSTTAPASKTDASKILGLGVSAPSIKYTIPKISKTQQASQSGSGQPNSTENSNSSNTDSQVDESSNPSSSANSTTAASSTTNKRNPSTQFNRPNNSNRNPVSSSTHPPGRLTSNPLAAASRPSSSNQSDNHATNRISSSNQVHQNMRQQTMNRIVNLAQQQQPVGQRLLNANPLQGIQQSNLANQAPAMFALGLNQQSSPLQNVADINLLAASQAALLNQQRAQQAAALQQQTNPMPPPSFMSSSAEANLISSSKPQFTPGPPQSLNMLPTTNNLNVGDSLQRPSPSVTNGPPQFYVRQPMFDDTSNAVSSTPRTITNEVSQTSMPMTGVVNSEASLQPSQQASLGSTSSTTTSTSSLSITLKSKDTSEMSSTTISNTVASQMSNQGVSSSSDASNNDAEPVISTPSSPTECSQVDTVQPPPLIPIDSLDDPKVQSPDTDHPDDASDRLSIVDASENAADSLSAAGTPKPSSSATSPLATQDSTISASSPNNMTLVADTGASASPANSATASAGPASNVAASTKVDSS